MSNHPYVAPINDISLGDMLNNVIVLLPGMWENDTGPLDWYAVEDETGIIAYFANEHDANRFRLDQINGRLNPYAR